MHGHELAEHVPVADHEPRGLSLVLEVLGGQAHGDEREEVVAGPHRGVAVHHHVGVEDGAAPETHLRPHDAVGPHAHARLEHGPRAPPARSSSTWGAGRPTTRISSRASATRCSPDRTSPLKRARGPCRRSSRTSRSKPVPRHRGSPELRVVDAHDLDLEAGRVLGPREQEEARRLGQALHEEHSRHHGLLREVADEEVLAAGDVFRGHEPAPRIVLQHPVHEHEGVLAGKLADEVLNVDGCLIPG